MTKLLIATLTLFATLPGLARGGDLRLVCTGTIVSVPNPPPAPFAGVQPGDPVTVTFEVNEPATPLLPFFWNYDVDFSVGGIQVGTALDTWSATSFNPGCYVQNNGPGGSGDVLGFAGLVSNGIDEVLLAVHDPTGMALNSVDLRDLIGATNLPPGAGSIGLGLPGPGGSVYFGASLDVIVVEDASGGGTAFCNAAPNSTGVAGVLSSAGPTSVATNNFTLVADHLPTNQFGFLINSTSQAFIVGPGGSQGNLCLGSPIGRHNQVIGNSGATGVILVPINLNALPRPVGGPAQVQPGETWNFQLWYRDVNPGATSNFTQGLAVMFS